MDAVAIKIETEAALETDDMVSSFDFALKKHAFQNAADVVARAGSARPFFTGDGMN